MGFGVYFANNANINVGVIITIWSLNPFYNSIADYYIYGEKMYYHHFIGLVSILLCSVAISFKDMFNDTATKISVKPAIYPTWVPVIFGLIAPISFTVWTMYSKHMTSERIGFNSIRMAFSSQLIVNLIIMIFAIPYWINSGTFVPKYFLIGFVGSYIDALGMVVVTEAFTCGPAGPIAAIISNCNVLMVIIEALKHNRMLTLIEFVGLFLGLYGSLILSVPNIVENYCFCCCIKKKQKSNLDDALDELK